MLKFNLDPQDYTVYYHVPSFNYVAIEAIEIPRIEKLIAKYDNILNCPDDETVMCSMLVIKDTEAVFHIPNSIKIKVKIKDLIFEFIRPGDFV
jgi:hypothetical protein